MILRRYDVYIFGDMYYSKIVSQIYIYIYRLRKDLVSRKVAIYSEDSQHSQGRKHVGVYWTRRIGMVGGVPEGARDK